MPNIWLSEGPPALLTVLSAETEMVAWLVALGAKDSWPLLSRLKLP